MSPNELMENINPFLSNVRHLVDVAIFSFQSSDKHLVDTQLRTIYKHSLLSIYLSVVCPGLYDCALESGTWATDGISGLD